MDVAFNKYMEAETIVFQTLLSNGYPKESIIMEGQLSNGHSADFLIVDINTGLTVMMIEVKSSGGYKNIPIKQLAFKALKRNCDEDLLSVKAIAAVVDIDKKSMEFIDFTKAIKNNNLDYAVTHYILPPYESLVAGARQKAISEHCSSKMVMLVNPASNLCGTRIIGCIWYIYTFVLATDYYWFWCGHRFASLL